LNTVLDLATGALSSFEDAGLYRQGLVERGSHFALLTADEKAVDTDVALQILLRPQTGLDSRDLAGRYHIVHFTPSRDGSSISGQLVFDALGDGIVVATPEKNTARQLFLSELEGADVTVPGTGALELTANFWRPGPCGLGRRESPRPTPPCSDF
jgi:hypothetical protein